MKNLLAGKTILIIGAGIMQVPLIKEALKQDIFTVVIDKNSQAIGAKYGNYFINEDFMNEEIVVKVVTNFHKTIRKIDAVLTVGGDYSLIVSMLAKVLGISTRLSEKDALVATNKIEMRKRLKEENVNIPTFWPIKSSHNLINIIEKIQEKEYPLVVKPADSMGARGVRLVSNQKELLLACQIALEYSRSKELIVEECISGAEFSIDAIVFKGEIFICGIADRLIEFAPYFVEIGHLNPSTAKDNVLKAVKFEFIKAIKALNLTNGAAKGDIFYDPISEKAVVGEIAARLSGGFMSAYTTPFSQGVNLMKSILEVSLNVVPTGLKPTKIPFDFCLEKAFWSEKQGRIKSITGIEEIKQFSGVKEVFLHVEIGNKVDKPTNNVSKCGSIIVTGKTLQEVFEITNQALKLIKIEVV